MTRGIRGGISFFKGYGNMRGSYGSAAYLRTAILLGAWLAMMGALNAAWADEPSDADKVRFFEQHVRPVLAQNCFECHGDNRQRGNLRLDSLPDALAGGTSGPAITPGDTDDSLILLAISYQDADLQMPPDDPLSEEQVEILNQWVAMGAPWPGYEGDVDVRPGGSRITDEDRASWAFQPVERPEPPDIDTGGWARNPIDKFVYERLQREGLEPAEEADRLQLIRRAYFDLIGLPPTPQEIDELLADESGDWYENMIDRLLESPHYGERWGRHWLDLARYADSEGWRADRVRPHAWRYREYVVDSFNADKPYDQFVMEQLAGDEIAPHDPDVVVATGFMRLGVYEWNQRDVRTQWREMVDETTDVAGDVFLGMSMNCARCHDHKFDPILQEDYYRLRAFFKPMVWRDDVPHATPEQVEQYESQLAAWQEKTAEIREQIAEIEAPFREEQDAFSVGRFPDDVQAIVAKDPAERTPHEEQIFQVVNRQVQDKHERFESRYMDNEAKERRAPLLKKLAEYDADKPDPLPQQDVVTDVGAESSPQTMPGDRRAREIPPGFPQVMVGTEPAQIEPPERASESTGRRTALARSIADPDNPLTTRVITNRIWHYHFGQGLVTTPSDFGRLGEPPSHPGLLDWLTREYVDGGWTMKRIHRLIMTSATYRQSARRPTPQLAQLHDPDNRLLWRFEPQRLDADQIRDAILVAADRLDARLGGGTVGSNSNRRTLYLLIRRNSPEPIRQLFDAPDSQQSAADRMATVSPTQALLLLNSDWAMQQARALAGAVRSPAPADDRELVDRLYRRVYGRHAESAEAEAALAFLDDQAGTIADELDARDEPVVAEMPHGLGAAAALDPNGDQRKLIVPDDPSLPSGEFTIEAVVKLDSLYSDATVRTIASQWSSNNARPGWSLGVTSEGSAYTPQTLILQLSGEGGDAYDVVASDLTVELDRPYYVAAVVRPERAGEGRGGVLFYVRDLADDEAPLQFAMADHNVSAYRSDVALAFGGRDGQDRHHWDGLIGEVRLSDAALDPADLLVNASATPGPAAVGYWRFGDGDGDFHADSSPRGNDIRAARYSDEQRRDNGRTGALVDLAHILLNSNEFIYLD